MRPCNWVDPGNPWEPEVPSGEAWTPTPTVVLICSSIAGALMILLVTVLLVWLICGRKKTRSSAEKKPMGNSEKAQFEVEGNTLSLSPTYCEYAVAPGVYAAPTKGEKSAG